MLKKLLGLNTTLKTVGLSPKVVAAFVYPVVAAVGAAVVVWISTGAWDWTNTRLTLAGAITGAISALGSAIAANAPVIDVTPGAEAPETLPARPTL